ncbi:MAG TPA: cytochrome c maturation protein CcmE [Gammaproteobacteria bacterium]|nr:cytochrome c maturation protein CcmE [Gammaproteobacteria bacterium]
MKTRHKRMAFILVGLAGLSVAAWLVLNALNSNLALYISPTDVLAGDAPKDQTFRLGGLVVEDSLRREDDGLTVHFEVTDSANTIPVTFTGILPDLFEEGQGVVAQGKMQGGVFAASEVLAKHDENYMPAEVADMLEEGEKLKQQYGQPEEAASMPQTP